MNLAQETRLSLSLDRLHRMRPSDISSVGEMINSESGLVDVLKAFVGYLLHVKKPSPVEYDDIYRISLQLKMAGVWKLVDPRIFMQVFHDDVGPDVVAPFCLALGIEMDPSFYSGKVDVLNKLQAETSENLRKIREELELIPQGDGLDLSQKRKNSEQKSSLVRSEVGLDKGISHGSKVGTGTVKFFNSTKGFGFIAPDNGGKDVFVHISALERSGMRTLVEGQKVTFEIVSTKEGKDKSTNIRAAG